MYEAEAKHGCVVVCLTLMLLCLGASERGKDADTRFPQKIDTVKVSVKPRQFHCSNETIPAARNDDAATARDRPKLMQLIFLRSECTAWPVRPSMHTIYGLTIAHLQTRSNPAHRLASSASNSRPSSTSQISSRLCRAPNLRGLDRLLPTARNLVLRPVGKAALPRLSTTHPSTTVGAPTCPVPWLWLS
jgi:hypothetical protein